MNDYTESELVVERTFSKNVGQTKVFVTLRNGRLESLTAGFKKGRVFDISPLVLNTSMSDVISLLETIQKVMAEEKIEYNKRKKGVK